MRIDHQGEKQMKKIWDDRRPNKGEIVLLQMEENKVVGFYRGIDEDDDAYIIAEATKCKRKPLLVKRVNVISGRILC